MPHRSSASFISALSTEGKRGRWTLGSGPKRQRESSRSWRHVLRLRWVLGLGYWAGDRRLANANILAELLATRLDRLDYDPEILTQLSPRRVLEAGLLLGEGAHARGAGGGTSTSPRRD